MIKIVFKNGKELHVADEILNILNKDMMSGDVAEFLSFTNAATTKIDFIINVREISHIEREDK